MSTVKRYILIAEDDQDDQEMIRSAVTRLRPEIAFVWFKDGPQMLEFLAAQPSDNLPVLMILDYKLPNTTAADLLDQLNAESRFVSITKMVWSASCEAKYVDACISRGAAHYFLKPECQAQLENIVEYIIDAIKFHHKIWSGNVE